ncbi:hypothetical protein [Floridanema evergladense]|uniref:Uncharacterized protein n=1 Tax=Floridaenema evergladense BLCC-F167 TaxID=3153639 RepID=A0ABV4WSV3_9CYAN
MISDAIAPDFGSNEKVRSLAIAHYIMCDRWRSYLLWRGLFLVA